MALPTGPDPGGFRPDPDEAPSELDRRMFHLKTLYDVSRELLGVDDVEVILRSFLLMTLGNFGVAEGFITLQAPGSNRPTHLKSAGLPESRIGPLLERLSPADPESSGGTAVFVEGAAGNPSSNPPPLASALRFEVDAAAAGVLGLGPKITEEPFDADDRELLQTLVNNLVVSLRNARSAEALKGAYAELLALTAAKDKALDHLSHELKTPLAVLRSSLRLLERRLEAVPGVPGAGWRRTVERAERSLRRLLEMQEAVGDILSGGPPCQQAALSALMAECGDLLEALAAEAAGEGPAVERIRRRIEEAFGGAAAPAEDIALGPFAAGVVEEMRPRFSHRRIELAVRAATAADVRMPRAALSKVVAGLLRNAVENTPDGGRIGIRVEEDARGVALVVADTGVGIAAAHQGRIFDGFFPTQETNAYSTGRPFDFNAGGKGADLLRIRIFAERYGFELTLSSVRCPHLPLPADRCPGAVETCAHCRGAADCTGTGGSTFTVDFPRGGSHTGGVEGG